MNTDDLEPLPKEISDWDATEYGILSAKGALPYQPGARPQVNVPNKKMRAESPIHRCATDFRIEPDSAGFQPSILICHASLGR